MRRIAIQSTFTQLLLVAAAIGVPLSRSSAQQPMATPTSWAPVEDALGRKGAMQAGDVLKFAFPRTDLVVIANGVSVRPALALGSWVAFKTVAGSSAMVMGDLVLVESEVDAVMRALQTGGVEQTALHNHVLNESPRIMYMHIAAHGDAAAIARTIHDALALSKTPLGPPTPASTPSAADLDTAGIARTLGHTGKLNGIVYQVSVPRGERITEMNQEVPPSMGVATTINFQPTGGGKAAIAGDFVMLGSEVNAVIRTLTSHGITVSALHSHMLQEEPRLFFMHFWANDDAVTLAKGLRAALDQTNTRK